MHTKAILYESQERVCTFECDFQRRWKPAAMFQHLTEAATSHSEQLGAGFDVMLSQNLFWVHSRMKLLFVAFPKAGDEIIIRTWPKTIQQKLFYIRDFEVLTSSGQPLALATSAWLVIDATRRRMIPPRSLDIDLPSLPDKSGLDEPLEKLGLDDDGEERLRVRAGYSVVDMLGHVNNSRYIEWICDAFPMEMYERNTLDWIQINYDREVRPGEEVGLLVKEQAGENAVWQVVGNNHSNGTLAFEALLHWKGQ
ncbi:MAG TPA: thioesterase [Anaerolineaceae bacterium]|nr:thioesterase [Anaerolineaceae bacterium]